MSGLDGAGLDGPAVRHSGTVRQNTRGPEDHWARMLPATGQGAPVPVLVVEDDPDDVRITFNALRGTGHLHPVHARVGSEALEAARKGQFGVLVVDYRLPDMSGIELCRRLRLMGLGAPILMTSSVESDEVVARAMSAGASDFLVKSLDYARQLEREVERLAVAAG